MVIGGSLGYRLLRAISPGGSTARCAEETAYLNKSKVEALFGGEVWRDLVDKTVIDFGCGKGEEAVEIAMRGARRVIGVDIRSDLLEIAHASAERAGVSDCCTFTEVPSERADVIVSLDAFEHYENPAETLRVMESILKPGGCILVSFGPPWFHPFGGHLFSVFAWAHLIFTEKALIRWRSDFKTDGATRFSEVEGGLNGMTVRRFEKLIKASPFQFEKFEAVPIRAVRRLHNRFTRELFTSVVRSKLVRKPSRDQGSESSGDALFQPRLKTAASQSGESDPVRKP